MNSKDSKLISSLKSAVIDSFENMVFAEVKPVEFFWGSVEVTSPICGKVTIAFTEKLVYAFATELMGCDEFSVTHTQINDIIAEMTNTVAGSLMNKLVKEKEVFQLSLPSTGRGQPDVDINNSMISHFEIDNNFYVVILEGEDILIFDECEESDLNEDLNSSEDWGD